MNRPLTFPPDVIELFVGHPWVKFQGGVAWQWHVRGKQIPPHLGWESGVWPAWWSLWGRHQARMREMLTTLVEDGPAFRASRAADVVATGRLQLSPRFWPPGGSIVDFSFYRRRGFALDVHPVFTEIHRAYWYGFALLLDARRDLARGLSRCDAPSRENGTACERFFWRSRHRRLYFCSARCARIAEKRANVRRQQRFRQAARHR